MQRTKRPLSFLLAVLMIVSMFAAVPFTASAAATGSYGGLNWTIDDDGVLTFSGSGAIPQEFYQTPVKLAKRSDIKKIIINESVTSIGDNGLSELSNLTDLVFTSAPTLSEGVFRNCGKLVNVTLPEGMTTIPYLAFYWVNTLTSIKLPSTITNIAGQAFYMTSMLKRITLPTTATVGGSAFEAFGNTYKTFVFLGAPRSFRDGELAYLDGTDTVCVPEDCEYYYPGGTRQILTPNPDYADQIDEDDLAEAREMYEYDINEYDYSPEEALEDVNSWYADELIEDVENPFALGEEPIEPYTLPIENGVACPGAFGGARTVVYTAADLAAANNVTDKITAIGTVEFSAGCKAAIDEARAAYDALTDTQKPLVDNYDTLTAAETAYANLKNQADQAAAAKVTGLIDAIGTVEYTDACKAKIDAARAAYDALTDTQKALVTNAADLAAAEDAYAALAPATDTPVYVKVTSEPEDWSGDYLIVYEDEDGDKAFNGSADEMNGSGNFIEVTISEGKIESNDSTDAAKVTIAPFDDGYSIKTVSESYIGGQANQNKLVSLSEPILNTISLDDGNAQIVSNTSTLRFNTTWNGFRYYKTVSQQPIQLYKLTGAAASNPDQEAADAVIALIDAIGTVEYTDASKEKIDEARAAYDALTADQKALVTNIATLTAAETSYAEQKAAAEEAAANQAAADAVIAKINAIDTVEYTDASKEKIDAARAAYDALTDAQKALVSNDATLTAAETAYAALEAAANAHTHDDVTFEAWESTNSLPTAAGNYYLANDVTLSGTWTAPAGVTNLCLNGHTISRTGTGRVISVNSGSTLAIYDCSESGTGKITGGKMTGYYSYGAGIGVSKGHLLLYGGTITGNQLTSTISGGGGVYVDNSGVVDMYGGAITDNSAAYGGAAYVKGNGAVFNFYGGTISGNKAFDTVGGGIHLWDKAALNMYGGTMSGNTAKVGAAVQASGGSKVSISGGTITGNNATNANGGALSNYRPNGGDQAGTFNISGNPVITGNTAAGQPSDVRLANNVKLTVTGPLTEGAEIGLDPACTASFVDGYSTYNSSDDPNEFFTSDSSATHRIVMDGDQVLLEVIPYDITINPSVNGAVSVLSTSVPNGTTVHLDVVPDTGYVVDTLTVIDGTGSAVAVTVTEDTGTIFVMPASDVTVSATFKVGVYNVSAADCNGTVTADPASAPMGETVTVTAVPDEGHAFRSISAKTKSGKWQRSLTALAGSKTGSEGYDKLVDGKTNTKYGPTSPAAFIIVKADKAFALTDYSLTTANDTAKYSGRNWKSWVIYGANFAADADAVRDSAQWQVVASVTDDTVLGAANYTKYDYTVDASPVMYQYYKVEILDNKASSGMSQMAEFTMTGVIYQDEVELTPDSEDQTKYTLTMPDDDVVILAVFDPVGKVTWQNWDGTVLEIDENVFYGETPEYNGETPAKASDAQNVYTFAGWDAEIEEVSGDKTYTATYDSAINMATVDDVIDKIDAIGDAAYTAESKALIDDAREAYNALTDTQKELVSNYSVLTDAEAAYQQLAADKAAFDAYKFDQVAAVQAMAQAGDSAAAQQIIADAASDIAMLAYDETKDLAENKAAVDALANITEALAAQRTADAAAAALAQAKAAAKAALAAYKNATDYRPAQQTELTNAIKAGNDAIDAATRTDAVATALANAKTVIDGIKTDAELTAEYGRDWQSVTIDDQISINFILNTEKHQGMQSVTITYTNQDKETKTIDVNVADLVEVDGCYKIPAIVAPAQIGDTVTITIVEANGSTTTLRTSIKDYCEYLLDGNFEQKYKDLAKATLEYGQAANEYFGYADAFATTDAAQAAVDAAKEISKTLSTTGDIRSKLASAAFMALTQPEFRFYFNENLTEAKAVDLNDSGRITTNVDGVTAKFYKNGDAILLEVKGIEAAKMDEDITVTVGDLGTITFSGYDFARMMANNASTQTLGAALYLYGAAAKACFTPNQEG